MYVLYEMERDYPRALAIIDQVPKGIYSFRVKRDRSDASITSNDQYLPLCVVSADEEARGGCKAGVAVLL
jgi:hypothetical protein